MIFNKCKTSWLPKNQSLIGCQLPGTDWRSEITTVLQGNRTENGHSGRWILWDYTPLWDYAPLKSLLFPFRFPNPTVSSGFFPKTSRGILIAAVDHRATEMIISSNLTILVFPLA